MSVADLKRSSLSRRFLSSRKKDVTSGLSPKRASMVSSQPCLEQTLQGLPAAAYHLGSTVLLLGDSCSGETCMGSS